MRGQHHTANNEDVNQLTGSTMSMNEYWKNSSPSAKAGALLLALGFLAIALSRVLLGNIKVDWDEELYFLIARGWSHGQLPYRDIFDHKPPAVYLIYLLGTGFGKSFPLLRAIIDVALLLGAYFFVKALQPQGTPLWRATLTIGLFALFSYREGGGTNTELLYVPALLLATAMLVSEKPIAAGVFAASALAIKYTCALDLLGIFIFYCSAYSKTPKFKSTLAKWVIASTIATLFVYGSFYLYFQQQGIDLFNEIITRNLQHGSGERATLVTKNGLFYFLQIIVPLIAVTAAFSSKAALTNFKVLGALLIWLALSIMQGLLTGKYYYHYFIPAFIPAIAIVLSLRPKVQFNALAIALILGGSFLIYTDTVKTRHAHQRQASMIQPYCAAINNGAYIMDTFLAGYRICGAQKFDKYAFPAFYLSPHFARISESGGMTAFKEKLETGQFTGVLIREGNAFVEIHHAKDIPDNLDVK